MLIEAEATAYTNPTLAADMLAAFAVTRDPQYIKPATTSTETIVDEIMWQKRVELWGEGVLFYDFKRLNYGIETGYKGTNVATDSRMKTDGRAPWWNFVIPEAEAIQNTVLQETNNPNPGGVVDLWVEAE